MPNSGWTEKSVWANFVVDSASSVNGKYPLRISYQHRAPKKPHNSLRLNFGQMILLPEVDNGDTQCEVKITSKSRDAKNIYLKISGFDILQNVVFSDSVNIESVQWKTSSIKFRVSNIRALYVEVKYNGSLDDTQSIWFDRVTVTLDI